MSHYTRHATPINTQLVSLGLDTYLAMLLRNNLVHTGGCRGAWR